LTDVTCLYVLSAEPPLPDDLHLRKLAQFSGIDVKTLSVGPTDSFSSDRPIHVAATCQSLQEFCRIPGNRTWLSSRLATKGSSLFLTGLVGLAKPLPELEELLPETVDAATEAGSGTYEVAGGALVGMPQFDELDCGIADGTVDGVLALNPRATGVAVAVRIAQEPCYIRVERDSRSYFLLACRHVLNVDAPIDVGDNPGDRFLQFVPFIGYLRVMFGARCWTNPSPAACFIIDDPLLRRRYGFLYFERLDAQMAGARFSVNIAFIPWNWKRTEPQIAATFRRAAPRLSLSVHGCDHTEEEFGTTDMQWLRRQARLALSRMNSHQATTGIRHNPVMIFPQGVFSKPSLRAIASEGFIAAVNSTAFPTDASDSDFTYRDMIDVVNLKIGGAPLFTRHYPDRPRETALNAFLGRQILIVEHHQFFREGYQAIDDYARLVERVVPNVRWTDLEEACCTAYLVREDSPGAMSVRAFGPVVRLTNREQSRVRVQVQNHWAAQELDEVSWNERSIPFHSNESGTFCEGELEPGEQVELRFKQTQFVDGPQQMKSTLAEHLRVAARRHLCEFRDNHLSHSKALSALAHYGKGLLPRL
jgi:hypothetical protein